MIRSGGCSAGPFSGLVAARRICDDGVAAALERVLHSRQCRFVFDDEHAGLVVCAARSGATVRSWSPRPSRSVCWYASVPGTTLAAPRFRTVTGALILGYARCFAPLRAGASASFTTVLRRRHGRFIPGLVSGMSWHKAGPCRRRSREAARGVPICPRRGMLSQSVYPGLSHGVSTQLPEDPMKIPLRACESSPRHTELAPASRSGCVASLVSAHALFTRSCCTPQRGDRSAHGR